MTDQFSHHMPSDERLVAFLDDQLEPEERAQIAVAIAENAEVAERVEWLGRSSLPFQPAYDELLEQAPRSRLEAMLEALPAQPAKPR